LPKKLSEVGGGAGLKEPKQLSEHRLSGLEQELPIVYDLRNLVDHSL
jgi:hypothetical protein